MRTTFLILGFLAATLNSEPASAKKSVLTGAPQSCLKSLVHLPKRKNPKAIRVGELNMENVFDLVDDLGTVDVQFLPSAVRRLMPAATGREYAIDWTREKLAVKIQQIYRLAELQGFPDVLAGIEIESETVAQTIANALGYSFLTSGGFDGRGVETILFYRESQGFELTHRHSIPLLGEEFAQYPTRSIQEAIFSFNGSPVVFHVVHLPSQRGPASARYRAAEILMERRRVLERRLAGALFFAMGDFNVIDKDTESPHAFNDLLLNEKVAGAQVWVDVEAKFRSSRSIPISAKNKLPKGTYYYVDTRKYPDGTRESWNRLDRFLVSKNAFGKKGVRVNLPTFQIHNPEAVTREHTTFEGEVIRIPWPYDHNAETVEGAGFSDHFGISVELVTD